MGHYDWPYTKAAWKRFKENVKRLFGKGTPNQNTETPLLGVLGSESTPVISSLSRHITALSAELKITNKENAALRAKIEKAKETLTFYAHPNKKLDDTAVPDFYDELDFGGRASYTLMELEKDDN